MSNLRQQLDAAKSDYLAPRYPGNLAMDLLPVRTNRCPIMAYAVPLLAAAAALIIYLGTGHVDPSQSGKPAVAFTPPSVIQAAPPTTTAPISNDTLVPQFMELTPSLETISLSTSSESFSVPAIQLVPSWDDDAGTASTSSTTQESAI